MEYYDLVLSGKKVSQTIYDGDYAFNTTVRNSATLRVSAGGRVEQTTVYASTTVSNAGVADSTFLSGGTMLLLSGGTANGISVLRNAKLTVSSGGSATDVLVSSGCLNAVVTGGDSSTLILGSNEAGSFYLSGGVASNFYINSLGRLNVSSGGTALDTVVRFGGYLAVQQGGSASGVTQSAGGQVHADVCGGADTFVYGSNVSGEFSLSSGVAANFILYDGGGQTVSSGGTALGTLVNGQRAMQFVWSAGVASATSVFRAGFLNVYDGGVARAAWIGSGGQAVLYDGATLAGAVVSGELLVDSGSTGEGESGGMALLDDVVVAAGGKLDFLKAARLGAVVVDGELHVGGGVTVSGATVRSGGSAGISGGFVVTTSAWNVTAEKSGSVEVRSGAALFGATTSSGGALTVRSGGSAADTTLRAGGTLTLDAGAVTTGRITWDFADTASGTAPVNDLNRVSDAELHLRTAPAGGEYTIAQTGGSEKTAVFCDAAGLYDNAVRAGESFTNAFTSMTYTFNAAGTAIAAAEFVLAPAVSAGALDSSAAELNSGDRAAKWDATTEVAAGAVIALAPADLSGNAWLDIAGADLSGTTLYGTAAEFAGTVNLRAGDGAVLGRLAAGADTNGSVGGVKLTVDHAALGVAYAGGFGSVTGATETLVVAGSFAKDFYAGALANYAKTRTATSVGDVTLTVESGEFAGNVYGASAVKMGAETAAAAHTAGNINVTLAGGEAENSAFCLFGGGYATGNTATTAEVYAAGDVDITVTGGEWGTAHGGRGIFGGVFASQVGARTGDVEITVSGGVMGNVYGGGWAQKNGISAVGDVSITIAGDATVANVYGGGSHSTSGGTTAAGSVSITVAGGNITGSVFARGQLAGDTVDSAEVVFTGTTDYTCGVFGYSYESGSASGEANLSFADYSGIFAGGIGGFDNVELSGGTAMTLAAAAAEVANHDWKFDVSERDTALAATALLTWNDADFAGSTVTLNLAEGPATEWALVGAATTAYGTFDVQIDTISQGTLALDEALADGDYAGWGFTCENSILKFKNLA